MTMQHRLSALAAVATFAIACTDPSGPTRTLPTGDATPAVSSVLGHPFPIAEGAVQLCKTSNVAGDFDFDATGPAGIDVDPDITIGAGGGTACVIIYTSTFSRGVGGLSEGITITETTNANQTGLDIVRYLAPLVAYTAPELADSHVGSTATIRINNDMARKVTFTNFTPPPPTTGCTFTKGWYRNNGSSTVIAVDGRTIAQAQAIFDATPGKPGSVTFGGDNTLLNLYQQLLAALNNLGGDANEDNGPAAVDAAIDAAQNGTGGAGTNITTTLTQTEMSALIETLSDFNEGTFVGWPHCDDN